MYRKTLYLIFFIISLNQVLSCNGKEGTRIEINDQSKNEQEFVRIMQKHLNAVTNRDMSTLKSTLSPRGEMQLILPETEIINSVDGFVEYHKKWFRDTTWTFETKLLNTKIGDKLGMAVIEVVYREPERQGKPYFNRMIVSYVLENIDGKWYIIKDHASSVEKSTERNDRDM